MNTDTHTPSPSKSEILLRLAMAAYHPLPVEASVHATLLRSFEALVEEIRRLDIPDADIDAFVADARAGAGFDKLSAPAVLFGMEVPDEIFYSALERSGFYKTGKLGLHPAFVEASDALHHLREQYGPAHTERPEFQELFSVALLHAPENFKKAVHDTAEEMGLMPKTLFVNDAGEPVYTAEQIAEKLGVSVEDVIRTAEKSGAPLELGNVHPVH